MNALCQITVWPKPLGHRSHICNRPAIYQITPGKHEANIKRGWVEHVCGIHKNQMVREGWTLIDKEGQP